MAYEPAAAHASLQKQWTKQAEGGAGSGKTQRPSFECSMNFFRLCPLKLSNPDVAIVSYLVKEWDGHFLKHGPSQWTDTVHVALKGEPSVWPDMPADFEHFSADEPFTQIFFLA